MADAIVTVAAQKAKEAGGGGRQRGLPTGAARLGRRGEEDGKRMLAGAEKGDPGRGTGQIASGAQ